MRSTPRESKRTRRERGSAGPRMSTARGAPPNARIRGCLWRAGRARVALALAGTMAVVPAAGAQHPLVTLPLDDPAYVQLSALDRQGCAAARISPHRPYLAAAVRLAVGRASRETRCAGPLLDVLRARFAPPAAAAAAAVDGARGDSVAVGQDLLAAARETRASEARRDS